MNEGTITSTTEQTPPKKPTWRHREFTLRPEETMPRESEGSSSDWLNERGVRFDGPEGPAWAMEVPIPIDHYMRDKLASKLDGLNLHLPDHINEITYLDLAPQEAVFPAKLRTVHTHWAKKLLRISYLYRLRRSFAKNNVINKFVDPYVQRSQICKDMLKEVFKEDKATIKEFERALANTKGNEILFVNGHGGGNPHRIGEQNWDTVKTAEGHIVQRSGNSVLTEEIIKKYDKPATYAAIILSSCNIQQANLEPKRVTIVYKPKGLMGGNALSALAYGVSLEDNKAGVIVKEPAQK